MTGLKSKINQKTIFQKVKMDDTKQNSTKKKLSADRNTIEDISKVVTDIKQTFYILENIVKKLKVKLLNDEYLDEKENHALHIKCNLCILKFRNTSELEKHIKWEHAGYESFECESCKKKLLTKFRLKKHMKMHLNVNTKICHYYKGNKSCPYDELGCKFRHKLDIQSENVKTNKNIAVETVEVANTTEDNVEFLAATSVIVGKGNSTFVEKIVEYERKTMQNEDNDDLDSHDQKKVKYIYTFTPKKSSPCEECLDTSECVNCIVKHMLGAHEIARLLIC